ncbi:MAG: pilus assembly protein PilM [Solirubrobacterales bacterium]
MQLKLSRKPNGEDTPDVGDANVTAEQMNGKVKSEGLTGLDISGSGIAAAKVSDGRVRAASITTLESGLIVDGEIADAPALGAAIGEFFHANGLPNKVRMGVASPRVVIRTMEVPVISDRKQLEAAIRFQAADHLPMSVDEAVIDHQILRTLPGLEVGDPPRFQVLLVAASRGLIDTIVETSRHAGIKLQGVDLSAFGLIRVMYPGAVADNETIAYLHYGDMVNVTLAQGKVCKFTRATSNGYESLLDQLSKRVNLTHEHAQMWADYVGLLAPVETLQGESDIIQATREGLAAAVDQLSSDITAAIDFHSVQDSMARVNRILVSGPGSSIPGLGEMIAQRTGLAVETPAPLGALDAESIAGSGIDERRLTLAAGLAMEEVAAL